MKTNLTTLTLLVLLSANAFAQNQANAQLSTRNSRPSTNKVLELDGQLSNQVEAFKSGQLAKYLGNAQKILMCPKDVVKSSGSKKNLYLRRSIKITSYGWSGQVGGYIAAGQGQLPSLQPDGRTYKLTQFKGSNMLQWETDELFPFAFNDAGINPSVEGISQRHGGGNNNRADVDVKGGAAVGYIGGQAANVKYRRWYEMAGSDPIGTNTKIKRIVPAPNDLFYGPRDKWGGAPYIPAVDGP